MGFNLEKNYVERTTIDEFLCDHPHVMGEVYDIVCKLCEQKRISKQKTIDIFNCAYKICTIATHPEGTLEDLIDLNCIYKRPFDVYNIAVAMACCLLELHQKGDMFVSVQIMNCLQDSIQKKGIYLYFQSITKQFAENFNDPINFSGKEMEQSHVATPDQASMRSRAVVVEASSRLIEQNKALQKQLQELEKKYEVECCTRREAESLQKQLQELEKKYEVECRFRRQAEYMLQRRESTLTRMVDLEYSTRQKSEALQKQLQEMKAKYEAECRSRQEADRVYQLELKRYRHRLFELQEQVDRLSEPNPMPEIPEVNRVFSLDSFVDYALSLQTDEEAKAVVKLLREFCWHHNFLDPQAKGVIESILSKRREAEALQQASGRQVVAGPTNYTYHIHQVGQLNPVATEINNQYSREE